MATVAEPKSMTRAKQWSEEVEEAYRFQVAGYRDAIEYQKVNNNQDVSIIQIIVTEHSLSYLICSPSLYNTDCERSMVTMVHLYIYSFFLKTGENASIYFFGSPSCYVTSSSISFLVLFNELGFQF